MGSKAAINKLTSQDHSLTVSNVTTINSTDAIRDLGVFLDTELSMKQHIACFYHISRLRQIRRGVGQAVGHHPSCAGLLAMIRSRLDYCNSVLAGLPKSTLEPTTVDSCTIHQDAWTSTVSWNDYTFSRSCVPSSLVSLTLVQPHGTVCPSQSTKHTHRQPSNDNLKHFHSVTLLTLLDDRLLFVNHLNFVYAQMLYALMVVYNVMGHYKF